MGKLAKIYQNLPVPPPQNAKSWGEHYKMGVFFIFCGRGHKIIFMRDFPRGIKNFLSFLKLSICEIYPPIKKLGIFWGAENSLGVLLGKFSGGFEDTKYLVLMSIQREFKNLEEIL